MISFLLFFLRKSKSWVIGLIIVTGNISVLFGSITDVATYLSNRNDNNPETTIKSMSEEEYSSLDALFRRLLLQDQFAYAIFGDKAVAITDYFNYRNHNFSLGHLTICLRRFNIQVQNGCKVWEKYKHHFHLRNYLFLIEKEKDDHVSIVLINKQKFLKIFNQYKDTFHRVLGEEMTAKKLLQQIETEGSFNKEHLNNNEELLGILLGFGKKNSWLYQRREELRDALEDELYKSVIHTRLPKRNSENELELQNIETRFHLIEDPIKTCFRFMRYPDFIGDSNDPETQELEKKYVRQRKEITKLYRKGKFLEITLEKLCS